MVIMIMEYDENQIDDDGYEQDDNADNLKMMVILLMSWRWWCCVCGHDDNEDYDGVSVITHPIYYHNQMKRMISVYDYSISMLVMISDDDKDNCR